MTEWANCTYHVPEGTTVPLVNLKRVLQRLNPVPATKDTEQPPAASAAGGLFCVPDMPKHRAR